MYTLRNIKESDAPLLRFLAKRCYPLDVHTHYTYWVVAKYFGMGGFILEEEGTPVGYLMTVDAPCMVLAWQIGILKEHRGKGLSQMLIEAVVQYAKSVSKNLEVTIASDNIPSYSAFHGYSVRNGIAFEKVDTVDIKDLDDPAFQEKEVHYRMILQ